MRVTRSIVGCDPRNVRSFVHEYHLYHKRSVIFFILANMYTYGSSEPPIHITPYHVYITQYHI